jgi:hypothetical protein
VVIALLVAVFYLAGGWYFSGVIHEDGLRVDNDPAGTTLQVERVDSESRGCARAPTQATPTAGFPQHARR